MKTSAIVVAGGSSTRYGQDKLALPLRDSTVLQVAAEAFLQSPFVGEVIVVVEKSQVERWQTRLPNCVVTEGGKTRAQSVQKGLAKARYPKVLIHDGARPNVTAALIQRVATALDSHDAVVPTVALSDSLVKGDAYCERDNYACVQTPQGFDASLLQDCFAKAQKDYTDEGSLVANFAPVYFVEGDSENRKLTHAVDYRGLLGEVRYGIGYDIHRLIEGRQLVLGGVPIDYSLGLEGHSDADCVLHATMDAMLSAVGEKDIGHFFQVDDERFAGADSASLLQTIMAVLAQKSAYVTHLSVTIIAERPRLAPYIDQMKARIAALLNIAIDNVGIAATTNEGLPLALPVAQANKDGIAAMAQATVRII